MKKPTIEQKLIAAREIHASTEFTDRVMDSLLTREIISDVMRKTNVKPKETFIMKLHQLHKPAIIAIAIAATFAITGTAYAIYSLWPKPTVETSKPITNATGRLEVNALFSGCDDPDGNKKSYELKRGSTLPPEKIPQILQAQCEMKAIETWTRKNTTGLKEFPDSLDQDAVSLNMPAAYAIESINGQEIKLSALPNTVRPTESIMLAPQTKVIVKNAYGNIDNLRPGDTIIYASKLFYKTIKSSNGILQGDASPYKSELLYVFKMDMPLDAYDRKAYQSLAQKIPCHGNEADECVSSGGVDLFMNGANARVPGGQPNGPSEGREIQGKLIAHDVDSLSVQGTSGKIIKFNMHTDVIATYNTQRAAQHYRNVKVEVGDMISVRYIEALGSHESTIDQTQISTMMYMLEVLNKTDPIKKY